jgi:autotransporter-associated beta strand protein
MKAPFKALAFLCSFVAALVAPTRVQATSLMENLGRGVVAVRSTSTDVFVSWRMLGTDPGDVGFNLYRSTAGGSPVRLNSAAITGATIFTDTAADLTQANAYFVRPILGGAEQAPSGAFTLPANSPVQQYLRVPLQRPPDGTTPDGVSYTYSPNDCSPADLDGDGEYELIVKWDPSNSKDNSQSGFTANVLLDAYKLDGTLLWRIDLGRNIRAGAHYTQYLAYDFDGDGKAELVCKTAPNTKDGTGAFIAQPGHFLGTPSAPIDHNADYRNSAGYILTGPEFFTIFNGQTGAEIVTTNYPIPRNNNPSSSDVSAWGDNYGNRVDRFLACVAYLDGQRPSFVLCRGYYTRATLVAYDWRNGQLTQRWVFDTGNVGTPSALANWRGQGAHSLTVGDVDGDGRDEITYGAAAIDDDGTGLYSTLLGHGDALHLSDMDPSRPGQEVWMVHEEPASYGPTGLEFRDAKTGALIWGLSGEGADVGRGVAGDIDPRYLGYEMWGARGGLMAANGTQISTTRPSQMNFMCWWDGDLLREILDNTRIYKWDWNTNTANAILAPSGISSNNSTKATPNLSADLFGDWREEVVWRENTNDALRIYTTTIPTTYRFPTLMHDRQYRMAIAWQNVGYNQPPHPSFYLGEGMSAPPAPDIVTTSAALPAPAPAVNSINRYDPSTVNTAATSVTFRVTFNTPVTGVNASDFTVTTTGSVTGTVASVTALNGMAYNVTVGSITGSGTLRLDLNSSGTGITGPGGAPISAGFTGGQTYNRATLAWIDHVSGGLWSNPANWDGSVIADGAGAVPIFGNFDLTADNTVALDSPRTISGATFGDTDASSAASWTIDDGGNSANTLTLDALSGTPTFTVNALGTDATATLGAVLAGTEGLAKAGAGTLVLTRPETLTGGLSLTGGTLRLDAGSALALGGTNTINVSTTNNTTLHINGGSLVAGGLATFGGGSAAGILRLDDGSVALNGGFRTNSDFGSTVRVNGGTFSATDINIRRNAAATPDFGSGFIVAGGTATVGTIELGNSNSTGALSVEGGALTVSGAITVGNNANSTRGGGLRVTGGEFTSTNTASGIILTRASGNASIATFSGGVSTVEKVTFGFNSAVTAGSGTLTVNGGTLYLGAGGLVKNGASTFAANVNLNSGQLGAKASWQTALPLALGGAVELKAADASDAPFDVTLDGVLSGAGGFAKTGGGTLTLSAASTFAGGVDVNAGALRLTGALASGDPLNVNTGGTLTGNGAINRPLVLNDGGALAPDGTTPVATLNGASLTWNGGGTLAFDLGASGSSDTLALSGGLAQGSAGSWTFAFTPDAGFAAGNTYTLVTFATTTFTDARLFSATGLPAGTGALFQLRDTSLQVRIQSRPAITSAGAASGMFGLPFSYTITSSETPVTYSAINLAPGLSLDPATGVISGVPTAAGLFNATIVATNSAGSDSQPLALTIAKAAAPIAVGTPANNSVTRAYDGTPQTPTITTEPAGLNATFTYNGNTTPPTLPGTYDVVATIDDPNYSGTAAGKLVITITALVRHAPTLNGDIDGSAQILLPENTTLNGSALVSGDLLVPGTPAVNQNGHPTYAGTQDANGATTPANYAVTLNGNVVIRHVVRRVDPIALPNVDAPPAPTGTRNVVLNSASDSAGDFATLRNLTLNGNAGTVAIPPGTYGSFVANGSSHLVLGVADATEPAAYHLQALTLNGNARLEIVGPVVLTLASGTNANGGVGSPEHPEWLTLQIASGGLTLNGSDVHGIVLAPNGSVTINGNSTLTGRISADRLIINGNGLLQEPKP